MSVTFDKARHDHPASQVDDPCLRAYEFRDLYRTTDGRDPFAPYRDCLDFRLSVLRVKDADVESVVVSTICSVHNFSGKIYLFFIAPFHRTGVKSLTSNAVTAKRL